VIRDEWRGWLENGPAVLVASGSRDGVPDCIRGVGVIIESPNILRVILNRASANHLSENLAARPLVAVTLTKVDDYTSIQFKGDGALVPVTERDVAETAAYKRKFLTTVATVFGSSPSKGYLKLRAEPELCLRVTVREVFDQTPGRSAGGRVPA
jgi:hypothetical protein